MKVRRPNGECLRHVRSTTEIGEGGGGKGCCFFFFFFFFFLFNHGLSEAAKRKG